MKRAAPVTLLLSLAITAGCHNAGTIPPGWQAHRTASHHSDASNQDDAPQLQIIICYGKIFSNHTALRLTTPNKPDLLWDPGGTFLQHDPAHARRHDVITQKAPAIDRWWQYRRDGCREPVMEVFQWSLQTDQANRLHTILVDYQDPTDPTQTFEPDAGGLQCCTIVTEFLMRFADGRPHITEKLFWPHKLGEHLWTQSPDRVLVFRADGGHAQYLKNTPSSAAE